MCGGQACAALLQHVNTQYGASHAVWRAHRAMRRSPCERTHSSPGRRQYSYSTPILFPSQQILRGLGLGVGRLRPWHAIEWQGAEAYGVYGLWQAIAGGGSATGAGVAQSYEARLKSRISTCTSVGRTVRGCMRVRRAVCVACCVAVGVAAHIDGSHVATA